VMVSIVQTLSFGLGLGPTPLLGLHTHAGCGPCCNGRHKALTEGRRISPLRIMGGRADLDCARATE